MVAARMSGCRLWWLGWVAFATVVTGCGAPPSVAVPPTATGPRRIVWTERFDGAPAGWGSPSLAPPHVIRRVYRPETDGDQGFLHALHDASRSGDRIEPPPAVHYGKPFRAQEVSLASACSLSWRWRVLRHPKITNDPWRDVAASVYVVIRRPGILGGGRGYKFAWLAKHGPLGTTQRGLRQIERRAEPAITPWRKEAVDLCVLYRAHYGSIEGEHIRYIGVVSDADDTQSVAEADYDDFVLASRAVSDRER